MKKKAIVALSVILTLMFCSTAFAGTKIKTGTTSGGVTCTGTLAYGAMWANAGTDCSTAGKIRATVTLYFRTSSGQDHDTRSSTIQNGVTVTSPTANADAGSTVTSAVSSHNYWSDAYGNWSRTITYTY